MAEEPAPPRKVVLPIPRWRSFRLRVMLVVLMVAVAPLAVVTLSHVQESSVGEEMLRNVTEADDEYARVADAAGVARRHGLRLRVLDAQGALLHDVDEEATGGLVADLFFGPDGAPTPGEADAALGELAARPEVTAARTHGRHTGCSPSPGGQLLTCHAALALDGGKVIHAQESSRRAIRALHDLRYQLLKLTFLVLPFSMLLAWWVGWRMVRPLEALRRQAMQMVPSAHPHGLNLPRADEFGDLAGSFNTLLRALEDRRAANETFVADLAHEFKNPVAAIRAAAESLAQASPDAARQARISRVLQDSSQRLDALVTQFLELARAEAGLPKEARTEVDLAQLARGIAQSLKGMEQYKDVTVSVDGQWSVCVEGVTGRLESALRNLMDNAASFAGPGGWVRVHLEVVDGVAHVRVSDSGPGIPEKDLARMFERFYTTRGERRGTGLGLALVRAVVEAHHGTILVGSPPGHGAVFEMTFAAT